MTDTVAQFASLSGNEVRQFLSNCGATLGNSTYVGLSVRENVSIAHLDTSGNVKLNPECVPRGPVGCLAKALTGALAMRCVPHAQLNFASKLGGALRAIPLRHVPPHLEAITLRQLLNHSHGLDLSHIERAPIHADGLIDMPALCNLLADTSSLFSPGTMYSYGSAGMWFSAGLLETMYGKRYSDLLIEHVLRPAGIDAGTERESHVRWCPANGDGLSLSVTELLRFTDWFARDATLRDHEELRHTVAPPGWSVEKGACAGWKYYGSGWYGHNMVMPDRSLLMRTHPQHKIAIVIAGEGPAAASMALVRLFGRMLPEYLTWKIPKPLTVTAALGQTVLPTMSRRAGIYKNRATTVRITFRTDVGLEADIESSTDATRIHTMLRPGTQDAYLADPSAAEFFQWIQFLSADEAGYQHLWNGRQILRRVRTGDAL